MSESEFTLKATPPRLPRAALERDRLVRFWDEAHERTALFVIAPAGFGKTTQLLQWRRRWIKQGALVAWLSADIQDDPTRFTLALLHSFRSASDSPAFDAFAAQHPGNVDRQIDALTDLLSEIAFLRTETVLMIDDAERLPEATVVTVIQYLLLNAPANLHVVIGSRVPLRLQIAELVAKGNSATLTTDDLCLRLEETIGILTNRLGPQLSLDERVRIHEAAEGWPLGLQLAIAAIEQEPDLPVTIARLSARKGHIQDYFTHSLASRLSGPAAVFLVRVAILDRMNVELCQAVTGEATAVELLEQLVRETPIMTVDESGEWIRFHPLARDFLLSRFEQLPLAEQIEVHARASH